MSNFLDFYMNEKNKGVTQDTGDIEKPIPDKKVKIQINQPVEVEPLQAPIENIPLMNNVEEPIQQDDFLQEEFSLGEGFSIPDPTPPTLEPPKVEVRQNPVLSPEAVIKPIQESIKKEASIPDLQEKVIIKEDEPITVHIPELENRQPKSEPAPVKIEPQIQPVQSVQQQISTQTPQKQIQKPITKPAKQDDEMSDEAVYELFKKTGTQDTYFEQWKRVYLDSFKTKKNNYIVQKCKQGLFRLDESGKVEILPNFPTYGKTPEQIMKELTMPGRENLTFMGKN